MEETLHFPVAEGQSLEYHLVTLFERLETMRVESAMAVAGTTTSSSGSQTGGGGGGGGKAAAAVPVRVEMRTLEFWRSVTCECLASFVYVFIVCGAAAGAGPGASLSSVLMATALAAGFAMATLTQCFGHISGAHINPAVSIAMGVTKKITLLRAVMFVIAQCGGGIAGSAFLYGVTVPGYQGNLAAAVAHTVNVAAWERFAIEFILTFLVVLTYFVSMDTYRKWTGNSAMAIGAAYTACTFVSMPYLNPARSLGPSFVLNKWDNHWVYWLGPAVGACFSGLIYDYILSPHQRHTAYHRTKATHHHTGVTGAPGDSSSSINSDEDTYDDLEKQQHAAKYNTTNTGAGSTYNTYRPAPPGLYSAAVAPPPSSVKLERVESLYGGTKSLYCKSPPLTRANLNRSQSVYTKSNTAVNSARDGSLPRPGPLLPAQSLYPMRPPPSCSVASSNQSHHTQNQNVQNQLQQHQRSDSIYGVRGVTPGTAAASRDNYASTAMMTGGVVTTGGCERNFQQQQQQQDVVVVNTRQVKQQQARNRPESMYGLVGSNAPGAIQIPTRRGPSERSDDLSYGSNTRSNASNANYMNGGKAAAVAVGSSIGPYNAGRALNEPPQSRQPPTNQLLASANSYHHGMSQHSPNSQY